MTAPLRWGETELFLENQKRAPLKSCLFTNNEVLKKNFEKILKIGPATSNYSVIT